MVTTESSKLNSIFCCIRRRWVKATEEERVRQKILAHLAHDLGFPLSGIVVEKGLRHFALTSQTAPTRRVDILCYGGTSFTPMLIVECKAAALTDTMMRQVCGYNHFINAPCYALANSTEIICSFHGKIRDSLPFYQEI